MLPLQDTLWYTCALLVLANPALLALVVTISASAACPPSRFNFFPNGTRNEPGGWRRANQTIAGNGCDGHLLPVATYGYPKPLLHFAAQHSLLVEGESVSSEYAAGYSLLQLALQHALHNTSSDSSTSASSFQRTAIHSSSNKTSRGRKKRVVGLKVNSTRPASRQLQSTDSISAAAIRSNSSSSSSSSTLPSSAATFLGLDGSSWNVVNPAVYDSTAITSDSSWGATPTVYNTTLIGKNSSWRVVPPAVSDTTLTANGSSWGAATPAAYDPTVTANDSSWRVVTPAIYNTTVAANDSSWGAATPAVHNTTVTANDSSWRVVTPAVYNITVTANNRLWYQAGPYNVSNGDIPAVDFEANATLGRRDLFDPVVFREGINTVTITVTLLQGTGSITNGTTQLPAPFAHESFDSPPIDFYFFLGNDTHDSRPRADVTISSCAADVTIKFENTTPRPVLLDGYRLKGTHTPSSTSQAFFLPTYYIYGSFVQGLDGSTGLETDNTDGNVKTLGVYVTRLPGAPDEFSVTSNQLNSLKEGWYTYTVEGSIWSPNSHFDNLMSVAGADVYSQKDTTYISIQADGSSTDAISLFTGFKGAGWVLPEYQQSRVGIQRYQTWLQSFEGPKSPLTLGSKATFKWEFSGLGNTSCEINGVNTNPATGICTSPLVYTIATTLNQTLVLKYTDVCRVEHTANMTFGGFGWEVSGGVLNELGSTGTVASGTGELSLRKSSKARRLSGGLRAVLLAAMVAFFLMVLLL